ncbi:hypothetical protein RhiirA5_286607, partial [Rhizophagus irregularis]
LRVHHGAVDNLALTERPPYEVFIVVKQTLVSMGIEIKREGDFKVRCIRRKRKVIENGKPSNKETSRGQKNKEKDILYGDSTVDSGEEIRFAVELCRIKNLPGLYIVDIKRMKGNLWGYKFLYHTLLEKLDLKKNGGYLTIGTSGGFIS